MNLQAKFICSSTLRMAFMSSLFPKNLNITLSHFKSLTPKILLTGCKIKTKLLRIYKIIKMIAIWFLAWYYHKWKAKNKAAYSITIKQSSFYRHHLMIFIGKIHVGYFYFNKRDFKIRTLLLNSYSLLMLQNRVT